MNWHIKFMLIMLHTHYRKNIVSILFCIKPKNICNKNSVLFWEPQKQVQFRIIMRHFGVIWCYLWSTEMKLLKLFVVSHSCQMMRNWSYRLLWCLCRTFMHLIFVKMMILDCGYIRRLSSNWRWDSAMRLAIFWGRKLMNRRIMNCWELLWHWWSSIRVKIYLLSSRVSRMSFRIW